MTVAGAPVGPVEVPALVRAALGAHPEPVWRNLAGGLTFRAGDRYAKWSPTGGLGAERARLDWARPFHPVPEVLDLVRDAEGELLVTRALPGAGAATSEWLARPREAVRAIGEGLRALHEGLPAADCPFSWSAEERLAVACVDLGPVPPVDLLVVCHGDACAPNTIVGPDGRWAGHVDLGALGAADRWADLAVASMSLDWNYGPGWQPELFAAYGVEPDAERIRFYRALWNADEPTS